MVSLLYEKIKHPKCYTARKYRILVTSKLINYKKTNKQMVLQPTDVHPPVL